MLIAMLILPTSSFAQLERNHWLFGNFGGLDFSSGVPVAVTGPFATNEGCATLSDAAGNLILSTDGSTVYNRLGAAMPSGSGLWGNPSSTQSGLIVPQPGNDSIFYVFTAAAEAGTAFGSGYTGIAVSTVNMHRAGGMGDVTVLNSPLLPVACEKLCAVHHKNGRDYWVITHKFNSSDFYVYPVTSAGIGAPIIQIVGRYYFAGGVPSNTIGYMRCSPDGSRLASVVDHVANDTVDVFDFNSCDGSISNYKPIPYSGYGYGLCFSPSGRFLYLTREVYIYVDISNLMQFDLDAVDIAASKVILHYYGSSYTMGIQQGPDNKLYIASSGGVTVINNPNLAGLACGYDSTVLACSATLGIPNFIDGAIAPSSSFGVEDTVTCSFPLSISVSPGSSTFHWSTGDTGVVTTIASPGTYWLTADIVGCAVPVYDTFTVGTFQYQPLPDTSVCPGNPVTYSISSPGISNVIWNGTDSSNTYTTTQTGPVYVTGNSPCGHFSDTLMIGNKGAPPAAAIADTVVCYDDAVGESLLDVRLDSIRWSNGEVGHTFNTSDSGIYYVVYNNGCRNYNDTFKVSKRDCSLDSLTIHIPDAFSPNGDGTNDFFSIFGKNVKQYQLNIYDRWGLMLFESSNLTDLNNLHGGWDGTFKGMAQPVGTYVYSMLTTDNFGRQRQWKGNLSLIK
jgi:gliding motility-associated-like protein